MLIESMRPESSTMNWIQHSPRCLLTRDWAASRLTLGNQASGEFACVAHGTTYTTV